jgi:hypothetical protein
MKEAGEEMSPFEAACWNWFQENVNPFTVKAGAVGGFIARERLRGAARGLFIRAVGMIDEMFERVSWEKAKAAKAAGG